MKASFKSFHFGIILLIVVIAKSTLAGSYFIPDSVCVGKEPTTVRFVNLSNETFKIDSAFLLADTTNYMTYFQFYAPIYKDTHQIATLYMSPDSSFYRFFIIDSQALVMSPGDTLTLKDIQSGCFSCKRFVEANNLTDSIKFKLLLFAGGNPIDTLKYCGIFGGSKVETNSAFNFSAKLKIFPNPFFGKSEITFYTKDEEAVKIEIFDAKGQLVYQTIYNSKKNGFATLPWSGKGVNGNLLRSGVYFVRAEMATEKASAKVMFLR